MLEYIILLCAIVDIVLICFWFKMLTGCDNSHKLVVVYLGILINCIILSGTILILYNKVHEDFAPPSAKEIAAEMKNILTSTPIEVGLKGAE